LNELWAQSISKGNDRILELPQRDVSASVSVETIEQTTPGGEETPETTELVKVDGTAAIGIEHANHHFDGVRIKRRVVAVHQSTL
jgi:hypothetical protein